MASQVEGNSCSASCSLKHALRGSCSAAPPHAGDISQMMVSQAEAGLCAGTLWWVSREASLHDDICYTEATALQGFTEHLLCDTAHHKLATFELDAPWLVSVANLIATLFLK